METFTFTLKEQSVTDTVNLNQYAHCPQILVQIFCGESETTLLGIAGEIKKTLPHAHCIGITTDGEIEKDSIFTRHTVIAVSLFKETLLQSTCIEGTDSFQNGVDLARKLLQHDTKVLIVFTDGTTTNGEAFVKGVESVNSKVILAGAMAGDNGKFIQTYVLQDERLIKQGAAGVALSSSALEVHTDYRFNWSSIGIRHTIDKTYGNRVYSIDGISAVDFYAKYLGEDVAKALPATGIEFPLILKQNGVRTARAVIARHKDGSLSFAGNLQEGDQVKFGFGNAELIMQDNFAAFTQSHEYQAETFFIYSCMARRRHMPDLIQVEIKPFAKTAPTVGFFGYGEFFHKNGHNQLLNQTITVLGLRESDQSNSSRYDHKSIAPKECSDYAKTLRALTHLINQSSKDYIYQSQKLEEEKHYSYTLLEAQKLFLRHAIHETNTPLSVLTTNIELYTIKYGQNDYLSNISSAAKNVFTIYDDLSYLIQKDKITYPKKEIELVDYLRGRMEFFQEVAKSAHVSLLLRTDSKEVTLFFNETKLQRIIDNNLTNAIKYTKENEPIYVALTPVKTSWAIVFESKSRHIQNPQKIFDAYYREHKQQHGLGLGLELVKQICEEEGIEISLSSSEENTSFTYLLPTEVMK